MAKITFLDAGGREIGTYDVTAGTTVLEAAQDNGIDMEGACEGAMACSTCHVILEPATYDRLGSPCEEEADMLDLGAGIGPTSRLGCQITLGPGIEEITVRLPSETLNILGL